MAESRSFNDFQYDPEAPVDLEARDLSQCAETVAAIREGIADFERGNSRPAREAMEELRQRHGIPRRE